MKWLFFDCRIIPVPFGQHDILGKEFLCKV